MTLCAMPDCTLIPRCFPAGIKIKPFPELRQKNEACGKMKSHFAASLIYSSGMQTTNSQPS